MERGDGRKGEKLRMKKRKVKVDNFKEQKLSKVKFVRE